MTTTFKNLTQLDIRIVRDIYTKSDYGVYEVEVLSDGDNKQEHTGDDLFLPISTYSTIVGNFDHTFYKGEEYIMYGIPQTHAKYGVQYKVQFVKTKFDTPKRIRSFLLQYVSKSIADQLLSKYESNVIQKIVDNDIDYSNIKGMKEHRFQALRAKVLENEHMKDIIIAFSDYGITPNQMKKIVELFGASAVSKVKENPYLLCQVNGIGFLKADEVAKRMGFDMQSLHRIQESIKYALGEIQQIGHSWIEIKALLLRCSELLGIEQKLIYKELSTTPDIIIVDSRISLVKIYDAEKNIAETLIAMNNESSELDFDTDTFLQIQMEKYNVALTDEQKQLFYNFQKHRVNFLIGNAGCGKSFLQIMIQNLCDELKLQSIQMAPTGKASKLLESYTGRPAYTIHRAIGLRGDNKETADLYEDVIVIDESSMIDVLVMNKLLQSIKNKNARLLIVGDDFQLPSVGVGNFLHDCVDNNKLPITKLTQVFRQDEGGILDVATKVRKNQHFVNNQDMGSTLFGTDLIIHLVEQQYFTDGYKSYYKKLLKKYNSEDIVVLTPTKKGILGTEIVNREIQEIVNPPAHNKKELKYGEKVYRQGDRIINIKNNYRATDIDDNEATVYNGEIGNIADIEFESKMMIIDYGFAKIKYHFENLDTITHAFALTFHKSQGSGFPAVILLADKSHKWQLNSNMLYTGITRTQKNCIILSQGDVINGSMKKNINMIRNTFLKELLDSASIS